MGAEKNYIVMRCKECGALNIIHESKIESRLYTDGFMVAVTEERCADCKGLLEMVGDAILKDKPISTITVGVDVERGQLDKLIEDVAKVNQEVNNIAGKIKAIGETMGDVRRV